MESNGLNVLTLNCGSSSIKTSIYSFSPNQTALLPAIWEANVQWGLAANAASLEVIRINQPKETSSLPVGTLSDALSAILHYLKEFSIDVVGHRVVHGGSKYRESVKISPAVKDEIRTLAKYAPLHNLSALTGIEFTEKNLIHAPQIAVFDTAFHRTLPLKAAIYPVPYDWYVEDQIQRFGFHGISFQYCSRRVQEVLKNQFPTKKMVICHLGAGASLSAINEGKSVDTTMGFTPLEGLMMNTRSGTIDPGIVLMRLNHDELSTLTHQLYRESGLLGVSGVSSDIRDVYQKAISGHERSKLALDLYVHRLCSSIGSMVASLSGLDVLVFTAGIGENMPYLRQKVAEQMAFLGIAIDSDKNEKPPEDDCDISKPSSRVRVLRIRTKESYEIARECWRQTAKSI